MCVSRPFTLPSHSRIDWNRRSGQLPEGCGWPLIGLIGGRIVDTQSPLLHPDPLVSQTFKEVSQLNQEPDTPGLSNLERTLFILQEGKNLGLKKP
eukprot:6357808-Amphidinium_carterae.1